MNTIRTLSQEQIAQYHENGFVIIPGFFEPEEVEPIHQAMEKDTTIQKNITMAPDLKGRKYSVLIWSNLSSNTLLSMLPRTARVIEAVETLLGTKCYHWHSKLLRKPPKDQACVDWHQGYGSWYYDGCLFPQIVTLTIAINKNNKDNGCLKCLKKSHLLGRLDVVAAHGTEYADPIRVKKVLERLQVVYCEMEQGDALFFHPNTLHSSEKNNSDFSRILMHSAFNAVSNAPYIIEGQEHHQYRPLEKLPDSVIKEGCYDSVLNNQRFHKAEKEDNRSGIFMRNSVVN